MAIKNKDIAEIREDYSLGILSEHDVAVNPLEQFELWFEQALQSEVIEPNAMVLSTINADSFPSSRVVLLKDIQENGLRFFTNYNSQKGRDVTRVNKVSLLFFWAELQRQVRIEGIIEKVPTEVSDAYFASRPRGSQIGAWSSPQSEIITNRLFLDNEVSSYESQFENREQVHRPDFWGGYLVKPVRWEFWQGRSSRLHDRIRYTQSDTKSWKIHRLAP